MYKTLMKSWAIGTLQGAGVSLAVVHLLYLVLKIITIFSGSDTEALPELEENC